MSKASPPITRRTELTSWRKVGAAAAAILVGWLTGACGVIQQQPTPLVPGSQWRVVAVDGEATAPTEVVLTFIGETATLSTRCGAGVADVRLDGEGTAVAFAEFQGPGDGIECPAQMRDAHERVADGLEGVERWQRAGAAIELRGEHVIRIEPQRTDT